MEFNIKYIKNLLKHLGFDFGYKIVYNYGVIINIDFDNEKIIYDKTINLGDVTSSNFDRSENFVVLECVDRLLAKGYSSYKINLQYKWNLGRKKKVKLMYLYKMKKEKLFI